MWLLFKIAFRNLRRQLRRTVITICSLAFGLAVMLWLDCIMEGRNIDVVDTVTATHIGHLQMSRSEYRKEQLIQHGFDAAEAQSKLLPLLPPGSQIAPRVHLPALISSGEKSTPIMLEGVDPTAESAVTVLGSKVVQGQYLTPDNDPACPTKQIYLGRPLAQLLNVDVGNKVVILAQATDGTLGNELFRVAGMFETGSGHFDKSYAFAPLNCVAKVGVLAGVHELTVKLPRGDRNSHEPRALQNALNAKLGPAMNVATWRETLPELATIVTFNKAMHTMVAVLLFFVISLGVINTLLMAVFERTREFGIMTALGTTPRQVKGMMFLESVMIALVSIAAGTLLGAAVVLHHQKTGFDLRFFLGSSHSIQAFSLSLITYPVFTLSAFLKSSVVTIAIVCLAALYPAWRASRLNPVDAMRSV